MKITMDMETRVGGKGSKQKHGGAGPSQLVRLKRSRKPSGQCAECFASGLPANTTRKLCAACRLA